MTERSSSPALRGGLLALSAAVLFGISTPLVQRFGAGLGPFTTAALLYLGAAVLGWLSRRPPTREAQVRSGDLPRLVAMGLSGAVIAPVALVWGLQRTSGSGAALMLCLEAVFTALLARAIYGETMNRHVVGAMALLTVGGAALVADGARGGPGMAIGLLAVLVATAAWGVDNTLSRPLAERDPSQVVAVKASLGTVATVGLAWWHHESLPAGSAAVAIIAIGATGYGLSLRLYLLAQRRFGAARTGSVFASAPFIGAAVALAMGQPGGGWLAAAGAAAMAIGVVLHLTERHGHAHAHEALEHEHEHDHDDGHHGHRHDASLGAPHSHRHLHAAQRHTHPHVPDAHHGHRH